MNKTAQALASQYGHWGEHPEYVALHWADECKNHETRLGYWDWVAHKLNPDAGAGAWLAANPHEGDNA